jgi:4-hydroxy-2-oxovalerate aldolase
MKNKISILECTVRDGSYLIDYQFTAEDTYIICSALAQVGFKLIEIGHGTGLRSSEIGKDKAAATDEEYLKAASMALSGTDSEFGMFFIPGIGIKDDLKIAAEYGMNFVRIGTNVTEVESAEPFIDYAKQLGMTVSSNLMKSYALSIDDFIEKAKLADQYGADIISVVDSSGGMFPFEVHEYISRLMDVTQKKIGFHGHNNLQLAVANALEAVKSGASVIDTTLQGMGRSAGNAQTEIIVMALEKFGYHTGIDVYRMLDIGEQLIKPMMNKQQGVDDMSIVAGIAQFHSSFSGIINETARKYELDPRLLILKVSEIDRINITKELAEQVARDIQKQKSDENAHKKKIAAETAYRPSTKNGLTRAKDILIQMNSLAKKTGNESVLSMTLSKHNKTVYPYVRKSSSFVIGNCEAKDLDEFSKVVAIFDGKVDWLLFDISSNTLIQNIGTDFNTKSRFAWYSEKRALLLSISTLLAQASIKKRILIFAETETADTLEKMLNLTGMRSITARKLKSQQDEKTFDNALTDAGAIVSFGAKHVKDLKGRHAELLSIDTRIYATCPNAFNPDFWETAINKKLPMYRTDNRIGLASEIELVIRANRLSDSIRSGEIGGIPVVSGGFIGAKGTIVVDSVIHPTTVIGIADGNGGILADEGKYIKKIAVVQSNLIERLIKKPL